MNFSPKYLIMVFMLAICGCAKYQSKPLPPLLPSSASTSNPVTVCARELTPSDCRYYFSRNAYKKGFLVYQLTMANNSNDVYTLKASDITLSIISRDNIAQALKISSGRRFMAWAIPSLLLFPILWVPAIGDAAAASSANQKMYADFAQRVLSTDSVLTINPGCTLSKLIFIAEQDFQSAFRVTMTNQSNNKKITFRLGVR